MPPAPAALGETPLITPEHAAVPEMAPPLPTAQPFIDTTGGIAAQTPAPLPPSAPPIAAATVTTSAPSVADDIDLIEKEWVDKAKAIVLQTRNDPHNQNKEMNRFKADYMKKRYNKDIKLSEA